MCWRVQVVERKHLFEVPASQAEVNLKDSDLEHKRSYLQ